MKILSWILTAFIAVTAIGLSVALIAAVIAIPPDPVGYIIGWIYSLIACGM